MAGIGSCGCASIPTNSTGILARFGEITKTLTPGLACYCCCCDTVHLVDNGVQQIENKTTTIDSNQVSITIVTEVQYQVTSDQSQTAFTRLRNPQSQMKSWIDNCLRSYVTEHSIQQLFRTKDNLSDEVRKKLTETMQAYGYTIIAVLLTRIILPENIQAAMNARIEQQLLKEAQAETSERQRIATVVQSEADARQKVLMANAESERMLIVAKADAEVQRLRGVGIANERAEIVRGLETACAGIGNKLGLGMESAMQYVLATQQLDALTKIGSKSNSIMIPYPTNGTELLRNTMMQVQMAPQLVAVAPTPTEKK